MLSYEIHLLILVLILQTGEAAACKFFGRSMTMMMMKCRSFLSFPRIDAFVPLKTYSCSSMLWQGNTLELITQLITHVRLELLKQEGNKLAEGVALLPVFLVD